MIGGCAVRGGTLDRRMRRRYAACVVRIRRLFVLVSSSLGIFGTGCGAGGALPPDTVRLEHGERSDVDRFLPLRDGVVYEYDTRSAFGRPGTMTIQIENADATHVEMAFGGRQESLVMSAKGARFADGGYLLKSPLSLDNSWDGRYGVVHVVERDVEITVPAGHFVGCIRTEENNRSQTAMTTLSVYCPQVGLVLLDVKSKTTRETAVLRRFGPRVDSLVGESPALAED